MSTAKNAPASAARPVVAHRLLLSVLRSPLRGMFGGMCELRFVGRVTGRQISLPVQFARDEARLVIYVGHSEGKHWWRNFVDGHGVRVYLGGIQYSGHGRVVHLDGVGRAAAESLYRRRYPKVSVAGSDPMVVVDLDPRI